MNTERSRLRAFDGRQILRRVRSGRARPAQKKGPLAHRVRYYAKAVVTGRPGPPSKVRYRAAHVFFELQDRIVSLILRVGERRGAVAFDLVERSAGSVTLVSARPRASGPAEFAELPPGLSVGRDHLVARGPQVDVVENAVYHPAGPHFLGVITDDLGQPVPMARRERSNRWDERRQQVPPGWRIENRWSEDSIYIGHTQLMRHFGHFLTEGISRLWHPLVADSDLPLVCHGDLSPTSLDFVRFTLEATGIDANRLVSFDKTTSLARVTVPGPSIQLRQRIFEEHRLVADRIRAAATTSLEPDHARAGAAYLSRSRLPGSKRRLAGERYLEQQLTELGVSIVHPQEHSFVDQIRLIGAHDPLVGPIGSAHHLSLLLGGGRTHVYLAPDVDMSYVLIDALMENRSVFLDVTRPITTLRYRRNYALSGASIGLIKEYL